MLREVFLVPLIADHCLELEDAGPEALSLLLLMQLAYKKNIAISF